MLSEAKHLPQSDINTKMENKPRPRLLGVLLKAILLFVLFNFAFIFVKDVL